MPTRRLAAIALLLLSTAFSTAYATNANHGIKWDTLMKLDGKYLQDKVSTTTLSPSLKKLLGDRYAEFMVSIKVQSPMEIENGLLIVQGMMPHSSGDFASIAFFSIDGKLLAVLKKEKQLEYFGDKRVLDNPMAKEAIQVLTK